MTLNQFQSKFGLDIQKIRYVEGFLFSEQKDIKIDINKNITRKDFNITEKIYVIPYFEGYLITKDHTICPYGIKLKGNWQEGWALDFHTIFSKPIEPDLGIFETKRPPIAEELYQLKYQRMFSYVNIISRKAIIFLKKFLPLWNISTIVPVPPSDLTRSFQPVYEIADKIGESLGLKVDINSLRKNFSTSQLKDIKVPEQRRTILMGAFDVEFGAFSGDNLLIFDDLYRSGETLNAICDVINNYGLPKSIYVLTITKTRSKR